MDADLVNIPVGYDLSRAQVIEAACSSAGFRVRLIRNEKAAGSNAASSTENRQLVVGEIPD